MISYKSLDQLVLSLIKQYAQAKQNDSSMSSQYSSDLLPYSANKNVSSDETTEIVKNLVDSLNKLVKPYIDIGLEVTASSPPDDCINISSGAGVVSGHYIEVDESTKLRVPLDDKTKLFYVNFDGSQISVESHRFDDKLALAKVVIPQPGNTVYIEDDKPDTADNLNGYIVSGKDILFDGSWTFDDDSLAILGNKLGYILAKNVYGEINLSENLTIKNTQGTLRADSKSLSFYYEDGVKASEFNRRGTYFYDTSGFELAKFTTTEARVGNIVIYPNSIESGNFVSGNLGSGFQIKDSGDAEFNNVKVRGKISSSVFEKSTISSVGGNFLVIDSDILDADMTSLDSSTLTIKGDSVFSVGDILRIKDGTNDEWLEVTSIVNAPTYSVTRDKYSSYDSNNNPEWKKGTAIVKYGDENDGLIYMTASDSYAPYLSVMTHSGAPWSTMTTHMRLGNLNGYLGYSTNRYGIAIGNLNQYLKYDPIDGLIVRGSITADSGYIGGTNGWSITTNSIVGSTSSKMFGGQTAFATGSGFFIGYDSSESWDINNAYKLSIGNDISYLRWNGTTLSVRGDITVDNISADNITSGTLSLDKVLAIQSSGAGSRIVMNTNNFIAYDNIEQQVVNIELNGANVGDVTLGNSDTGYVKWDKSANKLLVADMQSPDYVANTTGYRLSSGAGLEVNTGVIDGTVLIDGTVASKKISDLAQTTFVVMDILF